MEDAEGHMDVEAIAKDEHVSKERSEKGNGAGNGEETSKSRDSKGRDRDRDRDRSSRSRDRKDRDKDRDKDKERGKEWKRSRDRDRDREKDRKKGRSRSRSRSRGRSKRSRSRDRSPKRSSRPKSPSPIRDERTKEQKEIDELTKDQRTVFVSQLVMKATEKDLQRFFGNFGKVRSVVMIRDKATNRHKGFAYVEMADLEVIPNVLLMDKQVPDFQKFPIAVSASRAEKNYLAKQEAKTGAKAPQLDGRPGVGNLACRVFIGNLNHSITERDLRELLVAFGTVTQINLQMDERGMSKGYAFATFSRPEEAQGVLQNLGGIMFADRPIKVGPANDPGSHGGSQGNAIGNWRLDDDEGAGLHMNASGRVALMAKLGQAAGLAVPATANPAMMGGMGGMPQQGVGPAGPPPIQGLPSQAILVKNMFDPATETEPHWDEDIRDDVEEECSKHGRVLHIYVEAKLPGGLVYLHFADLESATKSAMALHGRWFAGRMITVDYLQPEAYVAKFPEAAGRA